MMTIISLFESHLRRHALRPLRRFILPTLAVGLFFTVTVQDKVGLVQAQVGSSISADGSAPNNNAMLDVKSPTTGDGKGILIPRVTLAQRTTASSAQAGGLLDSSGNLRGGPAQGLIVYQTDGAPGLYVNTNAATTPAWVYLGDVTGLLVSNVWAAANSTTNYLARTGGTMSGALNMGAQTVTNVASIDFNGDYVSVGRSANGSDSGAAVGYLARGTNYGAAVGRSANGSIDGAALGYLANGYVGGVAMGRSANGSIYSAALGYQANSYWYGVAVGTDAIGTNYGVAVGTSANGSDFGAAVGRSANASTYGAAVGFLADGNNYGAAIGYAATGSTYGAAVGFLANGYSYGAAVGEQANGTNYGAAMGNYARGYKSGAAVGYYAYGYNSGVAVGYLAKGFDDGAAMGRQANGSSYGAAMGEQANGTNYGAAMGFSANGSGYGAAMGVAANGSKTNVAIGMRANAQAGTEQIAIGHNVTNNLPNTARIRGTLYLDGGTGVMYRANFGEGSTWTAKTFEIDHPLDPENKILRHFCLEGPAVWNVYAGNAQLVNGQAVIQLPDYYSALNLVGSEIYSLTPIGGRADTWVQHEVRDNRFLIQGEKDIKVSWTIKVLRNDPGCLEDLRRRPVEQRKHDLAR